jgi:shikimate 5-dehydrogenase
MYFLGVTTGQSAIHKIFPRWTALAGIDRAGLKGIDIPVDAPPAQYRSAVEAVLKDGEAEGALVTTHKVNIFRHAHDLFTGFDADAARLGEVNCIVRRPNQLAGLATDTLTAGLALREIVEQPFRGSALIFGAGGAAVALAVNLFRDHQPAEVILTDLSAARLQQVQALTPARCQQVTTPADHDRLVARLPRDSLIVNATGTGKDRPGAPVTENVRFPEGAIAWDFNYRGDLAWLNRARAQSVRTADGWRYFLHGWSQVMSRVYGFDLNPALFSRMVAAAS